MQSAARITDPHACADSGPNVGATLQILQGSPNILINGLPAARLGDPVSCHLTSGTHSSHHCRRLFHRIF